MVAVRDHSTFEGAPVQTAGVIETKQFTSAVAAGAAKAEELRKMSGPKVNSGLARISAALLEPSISNAPGLGRRSIISGAGKSRLTHPLSSSAAVLAETSSDVFFYRLPLNVFLDTLIRKSNIFVL